MVKEVHIMNIVELQANILSGELDMKLDIDTIEKLYKSFNPCPTCWMWDKPLLLRRELIPLDSKCPRCQHPSLEVIVAEFKSACKALGY